MKQFSADIHHWRCPGTLGACACGALWEAEDAAAASDDLDCAYGQFYDPDFDANPRAAREPYGGWNRAHRGQP